MMKEIKFKKSRIILGIIFSLFMLFVSICFISKPERFILNVFMKPIHIQIIGTISLFFMSALFYSLIRIYPRKFALKIEDNYLMDNSKYESLGKIEWKEVKKIQRIKKNSIEIFLKKPITSYKQLNLIQKFLLFMQNWNYNKSILISSALMESSIDELYEMISVAYENYKLR